MIKITNYAVVLSVVITLPVLGDETPKLHPLEAACIDYEMTGQMMTGKVTRCHRDYAYESYEIQEGNISFGGYTQPQNQNTIIIGNTVYVIDLKTQTGTRTVNPMYEKIVTSIAGKSPEEMSQAFMTAMGFSPTGESKTIAGHECEVSGSAMLGTVCISDDLLMLEQSMMGNTRTATSVSIGEQGQDDNYTQYTRVTITDGPDLSNMPDLQKLMNPQKQ